MGYARVNIKLLNNAKNTPTTWKIPSDIDNGKAVTFRFEYEWTNSTTCKISNIKWYPSQYHEADNTWWPIINNTGTTITSNTKVVFSNNEFNQSGKIKLTFGSTVRAVNKKLDGCYSGNTLNNLKNTDDTDVTISVTNIQAPQLFGSFEYSYTVRYVNGNWVQVTSTTPTSEYSDIEYFIKIDNIRIPKTSKYQNNVVFTKAGVNELIEFIRRYPITKIEEVTNSTTWNNYTQGKPCLKVTYGGGDTSQVFNGYKKADGTSQSATTAGFQYIPVGSNITFPEETSPVPNTQATGTIRININGVVHEIPVKGLAGQGNGEITLNGTTVVGGHLLPSKDAVTTNGGEWNIGSLDKDPNTAGNQYRRWRNLYLTGDIGASTSKMGTLYATNLGASDSLISNAYITNLGAASTPITNAYITNLGASGTPVSNAYITDLGATNTPVTNAYITNLGSSGKPVTNAYITNLKIPSGSTLGINGPLNITSTAGYTEAAEKPTDASGSYGNNAISCAGGAYFAKNLSAMRVYNAVFNDYAECRTTIDLTPGHVVVDQDDGSLACSSKRLQPGAQVISDTYGHLMGETDKAKTPIAVAGRVLVYTYQPRENYHAGMAVCSAPDGTVDIMSRTEICEYPDCIVGIVSEIPQYETWGSDNVKVDGRIWIKVK